MSELLIQGILIALIIILAAWKICKKAGFSPYLSLIVFIPLLGPVILMLILSFLNWPVVKKKASGGVTAFMFGLGFPEIVILFIIIILVWLPIRIVRKAGYSGWWGLLMLIPILNLVPTYVFAFSNWPILRAESAKAVKSTRD